MKALIVANWKMNPSTLKEARALFESCKKNVDRYSSVLIVLAPPSLYIPTLRSGYRGKKIAFAIQDARSESSGAYTGAISMEQTKDAGATYVIIGHAERRALGETNEDTRAKVLTALTTKLVPILCVGEHTRSEKGEHFEFVKTQLRIGLAEAKTQLSKVVIAYEPVWAIGSNRAMTSHEMHEMAIFIRKSVSEYYGPSGMKIKILYGGSIDAKNGPEMMREGDVDGLLVGRTSINAKEFGMLMQGVNSL